MAQEVLKTDIEEGIEWLLDREKSQNHLEDEHLIEIAAEIENEDFEPLEPFEQEKERHRLSPFKQRDANPLFYSNLGGVTGAFGGMYTAFAVAHQTLLPGPGDELSILVIYGSMFAGAALCGKAGHNTGKWVNKQHSSQDFNKTEIEPELESPVYELIANSDIVESVEGSSDLGVYDNVRADSVSAAKMYETALETMEAERSFWREKVFLNDYEILNEEGKALLDSYSEDELSESELAEALKASEEISDDQQELLERDRKALEATEVSAFLKYSSFSREIEAEDTDTFVYDGVAYELEVFQGEDRVLSIDGVYSGDSFNRVLDGAEV